MPKSESSQEMENPLCLIPSSENMYICTQITHKYVKAHLEIQIVMKQGI